MFRSVVLLLAFGGAYATDCDISATSCQNCTSEASTCGWCDGSLYINDDLSSGSCIDPSTTEQWSCDGVFKSSTECDCEVGGAPNILVQYGVWRGYRIDDSDEVNQEVNFQMNFGDNGDYVVWVDMENGNRTGSVVSEEGCPRSSTCTGDQIFIDFTPLTPSTDLQCTYRIDWQSGPDAHTIAMGCNSDGYAPDCFDQGEMLYVFWACEDHNCPFALNALSDDDTAVSNSPFPQALPSQEEGQVAVADDSCSANTDCSSCTEAAGCAWCIGTLIDSADNTQASGATCFSTSDTSDQCQGTTLTSTCTVYKCPWYEYYLQDPSTQGDCSSLTCSETTGDDPDFTRSDTPAMAYSSQDSCNQNCVDPTTGCEEDTCIRTYACNASSTCAACGEDANLPTHFKGIQMNVGYSAGIWTLDINSKFTQATWTSPSGVITTADIENWLYDGTEYVSNWITTTTLGVQTVHAARMYISTGGALAQNSYLAISPNSEPINWNQGITSAYNGTEFALLTCQGSNGTEVSGLNDIISCAI